MIELLKDEESDVRSDAAWALGNISIQYNQDEQSKLVLRLATLSKKIFTLISGRKKSYINTITQIKTATGRRFIKELKGINLKEEI